MRHIFLFLFLSSLVSCVSAPPRSPVSEEIQAEWIRPYRTLRSELEDPTLSREVRIKNCEKLEALELKATSKWNLPFEFATVAKKGRNQVCALSDQSENSDSSATIDRMIHTRRFQEALTVLDKILADASSTLDLRILALDRKAKIKKLNHDKKAWLENLELWLTLIRSRQSPTLKSSSDALDQLSSQSQAIVKVARARWTLHQTHSALDLLKELERELNSQRSQLRTEKLQVPLAEARFVRARIYEERGQRKTAARVYDALLADWLQVGSAWWTEPVMQKAFWARAWNLYRLGRFKEAAESFSQLIQRAPTEAQKSRALFWLANCLIQKKDQTERLSLLEQLAAQPYGYYRDLAHLELNRPMQPLTAAVRDSSTSDRTPPPQFERHLIALEWLREIGISETPNHYAKEVDYFSNSTWSQLSDADAIDHFDQLHRKQFHKTALDVLSSLPQPRFEALTHDRIDLAFPMAFSRSVVSAGQENNIEPELIAALIRQESRFDPLARSPADAFGLMQLIEPMGRKASAADSSSEFQMNTLFNPEINIRLGSRFLRDLLTRYEGRLVLALAAYNANEHAIENWLKTRSKTTDLEFIEEIPYEETRNYVKLILRNYFVYKRMRAAEPFSYPREILKVWPNSNPRRTSKKN